MKLTRKLTALAMAVLLAFTLALCAVLFALAWRKVQDEEV